MDTENMDVNYATRRLEDRIINVCVISDVGKRRGNNEDNFVLQNVINEESVNKIGKEVKYDNNGNWICIGVFDGMGGVDNGEIASLYAAKRFIDVLNEVEEYNYDKVDELIRNAYTNANRDVVTAKNESPMAGTTGTVFVTNGNKFKIFHIGDSRAYLLKGEEMFQLTVDQTLAEMKKRLGLYDENDPESRMEEHQLTSFIGCDDTMENLVPKESDWMEVQTGSKILLCSDGLYDMVDNQTIYEYLGAEEDIISISKHLVRQAIKNGGEDNITTGIIWFESDN